MANTREIENLFFALLRDPVSPDIAATVQSLREADWEALSALAFSTALAPAFYKEIREVNEGKIHEKMLSKLKDFYLFNLRKNIFLEDELKKLLAHVQNYGLTFVPLKGPTMTRFLYKDIALRQGGADLDILVRHDDALPLCRALEGMGYGCDPEGLRPSYRRQATFFKPPREGKAGIEIDLHWDFRDGFTKTHVKEFLRGAKEADVGGYRVLMPLSDDLLLYLALTAITDFDFVQIKYLYDMDTLIAFSGEDIGWDNVTALAERLGLGAVLYFCLQLLKEFFSTEIPCNVVQRLAPPLIKRKLLTIWINKDAIVRRRAAIAASITWRTFISSYLLSGTLSACAKIVIKKIFVPIDEVTRPYGKISRIKACLFYLKRLMKPLARLSHGVRGQISIINKIIDVIK